MAVRVEPWNEAVRELVESEFGPAKHWTVEQGRGGWQPPSDGEFWSRCLILFDTTAPVAVASAFHPRLHPAREWLYVEVAPAQRLKGWGTEAVKALRAALPDHAGPLRAKVQADSPAAAMAASQQMTPIQRTREVHIQVPADLTVTGTVRDLDPADPGAIAAWRTWYIEGHHWDPPAPQPDQFWAGMSTDTEHVIAVADESGIVGIGHTYTDNGVQWFVGGALHRDPEIAATLLVAAQRRQPGIPIRIELDDWMTDVSAVIDTLDHTVIEEAFIVAEQAAATPAVETRTSL